MALNMSHTQNLDGSVKKFLLYPIPAGNTLCIRGMEPFFQPLDLQVRDLQGRNVVKFSSASGCRDNINIDVSGLSNGVYLYTLRSGNRKQSGKFIVQHP